MSRVFQLDSVVLSFTGHTDHFFQGLSSNTLDAPVNAFLNQHARIVATFEQQRLSEQHVHIVVAQQAQELLMKHIQKYLLLNKTACEVVNAMVYADLDMSLEIQPGDHIFNAPVGRLVCTQRVLSTTVSQEAFDVIRLDHDWPLHTVDYHQEMILNVSERFVSFSKGCFLGQEPVSKVHNRSTPSRQLRSVYLDEIDSESKSHVTSIVRDPKQGRDRGFVFLSTKKQ